MRRNLAIYAAVVMGAMLIAVDFASVDLAIPALEKQFALNLNGVQWVINGYVISFAVLMVAGGKIADAHGRRKVFLVGIGIFALASLFGGMAWSGGSVIAFRVLQGVGAALLWPAMIGMTCAAVGDSNRAFALGLILGTCSLGNAIGPVVGGALTQWFSWRWVLWINVPIAAATMLLTLWKVGRDEKHKGDPPRNDYLGMMVLTVGLVSLMIVVYQFQSWGWGSPKIIGLTVLALGLLVSFPFLEKRCPEPLVPLDLMCSPEFRTLCIAAMVICQLFFIVLLYFTQYAMKFLGDDPMMAGLRVVSFMLSYGVVAYFCGPLSAWLGTRGLLVAGLVSASVASVLLGITGPGATWLTFNALLILLGIGVGAVIPTVSNRAIETVGIEKASLASGLIFMCQLAGSAVLLAVNTAIFTAVSKFRLQQILADKGVTLDAIDKLQVEGVLTGAQNIDQLHLQNHGITKLGELAEFVNWAYLDGLQIAMWFSAGLGALTLWLVIRYVPQREDKANKLAG